MFSRPLVPALCATIIGILIGHNCLTDINLSPVFPPLIILLCLGISFFLPFKARYWLLIGLFLLLGINTQLHKSMPSSLAEIIMSKHERVVIEGTIYKAPKIRLNMADLHIHAEKLYWSTESRKVRFNLLVKVYGYREGLKIGERIRFPARLETFRNFNNPGRFDYRHYMQSRGIYFMAIVSDAHYIVPMGKGNLGLVEEIMEGIRGPLRRFFSKRLSGDSSPIYSALILGERQGLTPSLREPFNRSGVGHIMAVSGLHLGLVAWLFFAALRRLLSLSYRLTLVIDIRKIAAIATTVPVIAYGMLTGAQVSSQRAMVMVLVFLWSYIIGREKDVWSSLSLAALIILTLKGDALFSTSFQLSFVAVVGILWLTPLILSRIPKFNMGGYTREGRHSLYPLFKYTVGLIAVTTAATIIIIPLIAYYFHRLSVVALLANLTVVPIIGLWVIPLGLLSSVTLFVSSTLAGLLLSWGDLGLRLALFIVQFWSDISWSTIWVVRPNWIEIFLFYGVLFFSLNFNRSKLYRALLVLFLIMCCMDIGYWVYQTRLNKNLRVTILDAGRGSIAFIQFPGRERMLIAHNAFGSRGFNLARIVVAPYLWHEKIKRIDYLFLINPRMQQTHKLQFMVNTFHPREVFSDLPAGRMISGVRVKGGSAEGINITYGGWCFILSGQEIRIEKRGSDRGKELSRCLLITKGTISRDSPCSLLNIYQTGALTIAIDSDGDMKIKSFLKQNLPLKEGGS